MALPRRLDKFIRDATDLPRAVITEALAVGRVHCLPVAPAGAPLQGNELVFDGDVVSLDGERIHPRLSFDTFLLNKPRSVTSTTRDPLGKRDLQRWLARMPAGVFPVGRLDRDTTGALLFTNDGDLATAVLRPDHATEKVYWLWLNESISKDDPRLRKWEQGMPMLGSTARAVRTEVLRQTPDMTELLVTLSEGKNRQIRRMARASDFRLLHLHRRSIGPIALEGLPLGEVRRLTDPEVDALWSSVGGRARVRLKQLEALRRKALEARHRGTPLLRLEHALAQERTEPRQ